MKVKVESNYMKEPLVSVIMSVYNTQEEYLREAIESILQQTYLLFEFIIIDDASDSWCHKIIKEYSIDKRIKLVSNESNLGLTKSLNKALAMANGEYIARMDSDDIAYPQRLKRQVEYMEKHRNIAVVGTLALTSDTKECIGYFKANNMELLKVYMLFQNAGIIHPTAMFRKRFFDEHKITYDERYPKAQDYALWLEVLQYGKISCLNEVLLIYRRHAGQITQKLSDEQIKYTNQIIYNQFKRIGIQLSSRELQIIGNIRFQENRGSLEEMHDLFKRIEKENPKQGGYNKFYLHRELLYRWILINNKNKKIWHYSFSYQMFNIWNLMYIVDKIIEPYIWYLKNIIREYKLNVFKKNIS